VKNIFKLLVFSVVINFIPLVVEAQNPQECLLFDANGKPMDLSYLCGNFNKNTSNVTLTEQTNTGVFSIPIKRREFGVPVIDVKFNGQHVFEMLLDTGASFTVLTPKMASILDIKLEGIVHVDTASDTVAFPTGKVASAAAGNAMSRDMFVAISPSLSMGLLGQNFFGQYDVTIKQDVIEFRQR
jgi:aspartyl protease family protein